MNGIALGCNALTTPFVEALLDLSYGIGHGALPPVIGFALLACGLACKNRRLTRTGLALLVSIALGGILTELLKHVVDLPRPGRHTPGFPSGHVATSFAMAAVLGVAFPSWGPFFYLPAVVTSIGRLYTRAHFVRDVAGGALLGIGIGIIVAKRLIDHLPKRKIGRATYLGWAANAGLASAAIFFFLILEKNIQLHKIDDWNAIHARPEIFSINSEAPADESFLGSGWSTRARFPGDRFASGWAFGAESSTTVVLPKSGEYRVLVRLISTSKNGASCQQLNVKWNGHQLTRLFLERDWQWYGLKISPDLTKAGANVLQFSRPFDHSLARVGPSGEALLRIFFFKTLKVTANYPDALPAQFSRASP